MMLLLLPLRVPLAGSSSTDRVFISTIGRVIILLSEGRERERPRERESERAEGVVRGSVRERKHPRARTPSLPLPDPDTVEP